MYLTNYIRPDIGFPINLLARYSLTPIRRHYNKIKHVLRYLCGDKWLGIILFQKYWVRSSLISKKCMFLVEIHDTTYSIVMWTTSFLRSN